MLSVKSSIVRLLFFFQELPRVFTATTEATGAAQSLGKVVQQVVFQMSDPKLFLA